MSAKSNKGRAVTEVSGSEFAGNEPPSNRTIVFLSYENPLGRSGGLAAVASRLPQELINSGETVIRLSPGHQNLAGGPKLQHVMSIATVIVPFGKELVEVEVKRITEANGGEWILFEAEDYFMADGGTGRGDPYVYSGESVEQRNGIESNLLRDCLFAWAAIPVILQELDLKTDVIVHANDWEMAGVVFGLRKSKGKESLPRMSIVLTLHNPFDHAISNDQIRLISGDYKGDTFSSSDGSNITTVLKAAMAQFDVPISTVSKSFEQEMVTHPLFTGHFASHYQGILRRQGILGIDNGLFEEIKEVNESYRQALSDAKRGEFGRLLDEKENSRRRMLEELELFQKRHRKSIYGELCGMNGGSLQDLASDVPIYVMIGRLDPGQKGYDLLAHFIQNALPNFGRFIISPLSPLADDAQVRPYYEHLCEIADSRAGEMLVVPFRLTDIYQSVRAGATWSIWPSLYEPFGGVSEMYIHGTPVVAHATGGLSQQVIGVQDDPVNCTGVLFNARQSVENEQGWREIQNARSPQERANSELYRSLLSGLTWAMMKSSEIYRFDQNLYGRMLANLPRMASRLSWDEPVKEYKAWYDRASQRTEC